MAKYCESSMQDSLHILPSNGSYLILCNIKEQKPKVLEPIWIKGMEDKIHDWKFLVAYYKDTHFELVEEKPA